jgi:hypothetical protein
MKYQQFQQTYVFQVYLTSMTIVTLQDYEILHL